MCVAVLLKIINDHVINHEDHQRSAKTKKKKKHENNDTKSKKNKKTLKNAKSYTKCSEVINQKWGHNGPYKIIKTMR